MLWPSREGYARQRISLDICRDKQTHAPSTVGSKAHTANTHAHTRIYIYIYIYIYIRRAFRLKGVWNNLTKVSRINPWSQLIRFYLIHKDMIYHIFKEAPKSRNMEIIKFLKEYKQFWATCHFSGDAPRLTGGVRAPSRQSNGVL